MGESFMIKQKGYLFVIILQSNHNKRRINWQYICYLFHKMFTFGKRGGIIPASRIRVITFPFRLVFPQIREGHPKLAVFPSCLRQLFSELQSDSRCFQPSEIQCTVSQPAPLPSKFGSPGLLLLNSQWRIDKRNNYSKNEEFSPIPNRSPHRTRQHLRSIFDSKRNKS